MHKESKEELQVRFKLLVLEMATHSGVSKICREFNVPRFSFYRFVDYVIEKFPFRISTVRTDRGHEFQARFHWHIGIGLPFLGLHKPIYFDK